MVTYEILATIFDLCPSNLRKRIAMYYTYAASPLILMCDITYSRLAQHYKLIAELKSDPDYSDYLSLSKNKLKINVILPAMEPISDNEYVRLQDQLVRL